MSALTAADAPLPDVVGAAPAMREVYRLTRLVAATKARVLIIGETGTGKELIARAVHRLSKRSDGPYVRVNCGALSESLLESELFGHVKGAFTGAVDNKAGRFEAAHNGTIFLDEISSMSHRLQVKLLRVLQEREFERVGDSKTIKVDVRVVAATNQALEEEIAAGNFRDDLYYRLNVVPIYLPPLRERREDIPPIVQYFLRRFSEENKCDVPAISDGLLSVLQGYDWPGNVRELENYIERLVVLADGQPLTPEIAAPPGADVHRLKGRPGAHDLPGLIRTVVKKGLETTPPSERLYDKIVSGVERELIEQVMRECDDVQIKAAARLGLNRNTLHQKLKEYNENGEPRGLSPR